MNQYLKKRCALLLATVTMAVSIVNPAMAAGTTAFGLERETETEYVDVQEDVTEGETEEETGEVSKLDTDIETYVEVSPEIDIENSLEENSIEDILGLETVVEPESSVEPVIAENEEVKTETIVSKDDETTTKEKSDSTELEVTEKLASFGAETVTKTMTIGKQYSGKLKNRESIQYKFVPKKSGFYVLEETHDSSLSMGWSNLVDGENWYFDPERQFFIKGKVYYLRIEEQWGSEEELAYSFTLSDDKTKKIKEEITEKVTFNEKKPAMGYSFTPKVSGDYVISVSAKGTNTMRYNNLTFVLYDKNFSYLQSMDYYSSRLNYLLKAGKTYYMIVYDKGTYEGGNVEYSITIAPIRSQSDYTYTIQDGKISIEKYTGTAKTVSIPSKIGGKTVTQVAYGAFADCSNLSSVKIPDKVTAIEKWAFGCCSSLKEITIPKNVTFMGEYVFKKCSNLSKATISGDINKLSTGTFYKCSKLKNVKIPDTVAQIGNYTFYSCSALESIELPKKLERMGEYAFHYCDKLKTVELLSNISEMSGNPFGYCKNLNSITVSKNNTVFYSKNGMVFQVNADDSNEANSLIICPSGKTGNLVIPEGTGGIGYNAFEGCSKVTSISIPKSVQIGWSGNVYDSCTSLKEFIVDENNTSCFSKDGLLYKEGYSGRIEIAACPKGKSGTITIEDGVYEIGSSVFREHTKITTINIPKSVRILDNYSFEGCNALTKFTVDSENQAFKSVDGVVFSKDGKILCLFPKNKSGSYEIPEGVTTIGGNMSDPDTGRYMYFKGFRDVDKITKLKIPASVADIYQYALVGCGSLEKIEVDSKNKKYSSDNGILYDASQKTLICCPSKNGSIKIPATVTTIAYNAFVNCSKLKKVTVPTKVSLFEEGSVTDCDFKLYFEGSKVPSFSERSYASAWLKWSRTKFPTGYYYANKSAWKKTIESDPNYAGIKWNKIESGKAALSQPKLKKAASSEKGKIKVTWSKVSGATGYIVYKKSGKEWKKLATVKSPTVSYTDKGLTSGKKYTYTVAAYKKKDGKTTTSTYDKTGVSAKAK